MKAVKKRKRTAPDSWKKIFQELTDTEQYENGIHLNDVANLACNHDDIHASRETIRVKLQRYAAKGILERISRGKFKIGPRGYEFFDIPMPTKTKSTKWDLKPNIWNSKRINEIKKRDQR